jgi:hypothetical protein
MNGADGLVGVHYIQGLVSIKCASRGVSWLRIFSWFDAGRGESFLVRESVGESERGREPAIASKHNYWLKCEEMTNGFLHRALHFPTVDCWLLNAGSLPSNFREGKAESPRRARRVGCRQPWQDRIPENEWSGPDFLTLNLMILWFRPPPPLSSLEVSAPLAPESGVECKRVPETPLFPKTATHFRRATPSPRKALDCPCQSKNVR